MKRREPLIYGGLLVVALLIGYKTWTRDQKVKQLENTYTVWNAKPSDIVSVTLDGEQRDVKLERRSDENGEYLWATVTLDMTPPAPEEQPEQTAPDAGVPAKAADAGAANAPHDGGPQPATIPLDGGPAPKAAVPDAGAPPPKAPDGGMKVADAGVQPATPKQQDAGAPPQAPDAGVPPTEPVSEGPIDRASNIQVREFPVGLAGPTFLEKLAPLMAKRDFGVVEREAEMDYKLDHSKTTVIVEMKSGTKRLVVGGTVPGNDDTYVMDADTHKVYVLDGQTLRPILGAERVLRESRLHGFSGEQVGGAVLRHGGKERSLVRTPAMGKPATWADAASPDKPDQTVANFLEQLQQLQVMDYTSDVLLSDLQPLLSVEYRSLAGSQLGRIDFYRRAQTTARGGFEYYAKTEISRVFARIPTELGKRVEQDLEAL